MRIVKQPGKPPTIFEVEGEPGRRSHVVIKLTDWNLEEHRIALAPTVARKLSAALASAADELVIESVHEV